MVDNPGVRDFLHELQLLQNALLLTGDQPGQDILRLRGSWQRGNGGSARYYSSR